MFEWYVKAGAVVDNPQKTVGCVGNHGDVWMLWVGTGEGRGGQRRRAVMRPFSLPGYVVGDDSVNGMQEVRSVGLRVDVDECPGKFTASCSPAVPCERVEGVRAGVFNDDGCEGGRRVRGRVCI